MAGSMAGCSLQSVDPHVALKTLKKVAKCSRTSFSVRASQMKKEEQKTEILAVMAPVTIASTVLASNAGAATALTGEDVTNAFYQVLNAQLEFLWVFKCKIFIQECNCRRMQESSYITALYAASSLWFTCRGMQYATILYWRMQMQKSHERIVIHYSCVCCIFFMKLHINRIHVDGCHHKMTWLRYILSFKSPSVNHPLVFSRCHESS